METKLIKINEEVDKAIKDMDVLFIENHIINGRHSHNLKKGIGACRVAGCGCTSYQNNQGTCCNLNSAGGTCNHLQSDHS
jgi:hypothetical protein